MDIWLVNWYVSWKGMVNSFIPKKFLSSGISGPGFKKSNTKSINLQVIKVLIVKLTLYISTKLNEAKVVCSFIFYIKLWGFFH